VDLIILLLVAILITLLHAWSVVPWLVGAWIVLYVVTSPFRLLFAWDDRRFERWRAAKSRAVAEAGKAAVAEIGTPRYPELWARFEELNAMPTCDFHDRYLRGAHNRENRLRWLPGEAEREALWARENWKQNWKFWAGLVYLGGGTLFLIVVAVLALLGY
jgi:hypothetical protein